MLKWCFVIATCNKQQLLCRLFGNVLPRLVMSFCSAEVLPQGLSLAAILRPSQILAWQVCVCILYWHASLGSTACGSMPWPRSFIRAVCCVPETLSERKIAYREKRIGRLDNKCKSLSKSMFTDYMKTSSNISESEISFSQSQYGR